MEAFGSFVGPRVRLPQFTTSDAINILKDHGNGEILAWLKFARSVQANFQYIDGIGSLPCKLINAILALRNWSDSTVICSLQWARLDGEFAIGSHNQGLDSELDSQLVLGTPELSPQEGFLQMTDTTDELDTSTVTNQIHPCFSFNEFRLATNPDNDWNRVQYSKNRKSKPRKHRPRNTDHLYWCTVCGLEKPRSYRARDQWKKHEKEHEITFECRSAELLESTKKGDPCVLCGELSPDYHHISKHKLGTCLDASEGPPTFKRRYEIVSHLRDQHACINSEVVAEKWRLRSPKRAWSCGFCVTLFTNLTDRLKHIGVKHFEKHQTLHEWSSTNIVKGLLLQPEIKKAWFALLDTKDPLSRENLIWIPQVLPDIQRRLEIGVTVLDSAEELAVAAYEAAEFDWKSHHLASLEANDPATDFRMPPPTVNRAKADENPWNPTFLTPSSDYAQFPLPIAQSATRSRYTGIASSGIPSLSTGSSTRKMQSDTETIRDEQPKRYREDDGLAAMMMSNDDGNICSHTLLQSCPHDFHEMLRMDTGDGVIGDRENYCTEMQI